MNPVAESYAATLLAVLLASVAFVEERFGLEWPAWTTRDGATLPGRLVDYEWSNRSLILRPEGGGSARTIPAVELHLWSKLRLLSSPPFQDRMTNHLIDLEERPGFRARWERIQQLTTWFTAAYLVLFLSLNWLLAGWIHGRAPILQWLSSVAAFLVMTALAVGLVILCLRQFGDHQILEYVVLAACLHFVLYVFVVWAIFQSGPFRSLLWYVLCWIVALILPLTLFGTALAAQVHSHAGSLDVAAFDRYLTEVWLRPMGLI